MMLPTIKCSFLVLLRALHVYGGKSKFSVVHFCETRNPNELVDSPLIDKTFSSDQNFLDCENDLIFFNEVVSVFASSGCIQPPIFDIARRPISDT